MAYMARPEAAARMPVVTTSADVRDCTVDGDAGVVVKLAGMRIKPKSSAECEAYWRLAVYWGAVLGK